MKAEVSLKYEFIKELILEAEKKCVASIPKYGDFDPHTDERNMIHEQIGEQLDMWNYNGFDEKMFPERKVFQKKMKTIYMIAYTLLREEEEYRRQVGLRPTPKKGGAF